MISQEFSQEFKEAAVQKLRSRGSRTVSSIRHELGISSSTLYRWNQEFATNDGMKRSSKKRPQERSMEEKLNAIIAFEKLPEDQRGEFLRREGLRSEHIQAWRAEIAALGSNKKSQSERSELAAERRKSAQLEKELRRKDKALAETSALLVLKKKANLIWGSGEDDE